MASRAVGNSHRPLAYLENQPIVVCSAVLGKLPIQPREQGDWVQSVTGFSPVAEIGANTLELVQSQSSPLVELHSSKRNLLNLQSRNRYFLHFRYVVAHERISSCLRLYPAGIRTLRTLPKCVGGTDLAGLTSCLRCHLKGTQSYPHLRLPPPQESLKTRALLLR